MVDIQKINSKIENSNTKLNYCIQILHYICEELDRYTPILREKETEPLDTAGARMYLLAEYVTDELRKIRKEFVDICAII
ncbi:hypothetical protein J6E39_07500 [bacterium]|nr:hypothetical protein [bacterium]